MKRYTIASSAWPKEDYQNLTSKVNCLFVETSRAFSLKIEENKNYITWFHLVGKTLPKAMEACMFT